MRRTFYLIIVLLFFGADIYSQTFSATKIFENCVDAVVYIEKVNIGYGGGFGSGFFINEDGDILTNLHVIQDLISEHNFHSTKKWFKALCKGNNRTQRLGLSGFGCY